MFHFLDISLQNSPSYASLGDNLIRKVVNETNVSQFETSFSSYLTWLGSLEAMDMLEVWS